MLYHGFKYILPFTPTFHAGPADSVTKNTDGRARSVVLLAG